MTKNTSSVEAKCEENCFLLKRNLQTELDWDELILKQANCKAHSKYLEYKFGSMTVSRFIALKRFSISASHMWIFTYITSISINPLRTVSKSVMNVFYHYKLYPKQSVLI